MVGWGVYCSSEKPHKTKLLKSHYHIEILQNIQLGDGVRHFCLIYYPALSTQHQMSFCIKKA